MRRKRSKNRGYYFRKSKGWFASKGRSAIRLNDLQGNHIRNPEDAEEAKQAYLRYLASQGEKQAEDKRKSDYPATVREVCNLYLESIDDGKHTETFRMRSRTLYDLCTGFPALYFGKPDKPPLKSKLHSGYGDKRAMELTRLDIEHWVKAHKGWTTGGRAALQAIRRALNYGVEIGRLPSNPVKGIKVPQVGRRIAYITPEIEEAIQKYAHPALRLFVSVCIQVGARPDIEFASLEARHIDETPEGQRWRFPAAESKGRKKARTVYVPEEVAKIVREQLKLTQGNGRVFRDKNKQPWTRRSLQGAFRALKAKLVKRGFQPEEPFVPYTCRHTYAKRMLGGFWGEAVTLEVLAGMMGNTPDTCWRHYAQWSDQYVTPFWSALKRTKNIASPLSSEE